MTPIAPRTNDAESTAMIRRFGALYDLSGLSGALEKINIEPNSAERVQAASERGPIVYILHHWSHFDYLALNAALIAKGLPLADWSNGPSNLWWRRLGEIREILLSKFHHWRSKSPPRLTARELGRQLQHGGTAAIFLETPPDWRERLLGDPPADALQTILEAQSTCERPIQLVPILIVWDRAPLHVDSPLEWFFGGVNGGLGLFHRLKRVFWSSDDAFIQAGEPIDLQEFHQRVAEDRRARTLRLLIHRYLNRESTIVRGPRLLPHHVMKGLVLDNPPMRELISREADVSGRNEARVRQQMERDFNRIAANFRWWIVRLLSLVLKPLWTRIYSGVDARAEDFERIREAMRQGTAVLVPSHKSHFDYLLLSWVFYQNNLIVPHVVAGMNLAIWPVSILLRGAGGFFVKRSFSGDRIFPAVFNRYLRELIRQDYPVEFFIEGGRTRSGKLLPPKLGVLGMVFEAAEFRRHDQKITLLPIAFAYEQVAEENTYARELGGEEKQAESMSQLVKARSVLRRRFGKVYLRVGEPIDCGMWVDQSPSSKPWSTRSKSDSKETLQHVGEQLIHRIGAVTLVLPTSITALALLAHHRRALYHSELIQRAQRFRALLHSVGAVEASSLEHSSQALQDAIARFHRSGLIESLELQNERVWAISIEKRISLDFHKNQVLHFLAAAGYAAIAIRSLQTHTFTMEDLKPGFRTILWMLRREFLFDPNQSASQLLESGLGILEFHQAITKQGDHWVILEIHRIAEIYQLFRSILESYELVLEQLPHVVERKIAERDMAKAIQASNRTGYLPESLSVVTLQNAVSSFREEGLVTIDMDGRLKVHSALLEQRLQRIRLMVK